MKEVSRDKQLMMFFGFAFAWSWGWWMIPLLSLPPTALLTGNLPPSFFFFALLGGLGPSVSALAVSRPSIGNIRRGLQMRLRTDRPGIGWLGASLLTVPLLTILQTLVHTAGGRTVSWSVSGLMLVMGFIWPLFASLGEEPGWRGYALPIMQQRFGSLKASLILGLIWGLWHLPADYIAYSAYGRLFVPMFLLLGPVLLTGHSIIMTMIYNRTRGSLLAMIIYHFAITMSAILGPTYSISGQLDDLAKTAVSVTVVLGAAIFAYLVTQKQPMNRQALVYSKQYPGGHAGSEL